MKDFTLESIKSNLSMDKVNTGLKLEEALTKQGIMDSSPDDIDIYKARHTAIMDNLKVLERISPILYLEKVSSLSIQLNLFLRLYSQNQGNNFNYVAEVRSTNEKINLTAFLDTQSIFLMVLDTMFEDIEGELSGIIIQLRNWASKKEL